VFGAGVWYHAGACAGAGGCSVSRRPRRLILAEGQALALWPIPRQLKQRTIRKNTM